ncbi:MAG: DUF2855 family protein [Microthrixaceae bacterium]
MSHSAGQRASRFEVMRDALTRTRMVLDDVPAPEDGQVVARVDGFGFTANNISYAVFGDLLGYWQFFPAENGWGQIPTWGFAEVTASAHAEVAVGTRLFGYVPMASHLVLTPGSVNTERIVDASPHRSALPAAYNTYRLTAADPLYDPEREDVQMLLWPLFFTGFVIDRFLASNHLFGADTVVLSSASSKTAIATAHCLAGRDIEVVGLTSPGRIEWVSGVPGYDRVVGYSDVDALDPGPAVFLDFAGDAAVRSAVHHRFGHSLTHSATIGGTHWEQGGPAEDLPGPTPEFFFAPDHWGPDAEVPLASAWTSFVAHLGDWFTIEHRSGADAVEATYRATLAGEADPSVGTVVRLA